MEIILSTSTRKGAVRNFVSSGGTGFQPVKKHGQDGRATTPLTQKLGQSRRRWKNIIAMMNVHLISELVYLTLTPVISVVAAQFLVKVLGFTEELNRMQ
jgi:hypothetical protein